MPDEQIVQAADPGADQQPPNGENSPAGADNKPADTTGDKDAGQGDGADAPTGEKDAKAPNDSPSDDDGKEPDTRARLNKQDFIIRRQQAKLKKQGIIPDENDDEFVVAPEDEEMITKVVAKQLAPLIDKSLAADDDKEITDFLTANPDFKPYEAKARRYMQHASRRSLPVRSIFYEVAGDNLMKIGAERSKAADAKAAGSQTGGGSSRAGEGAQDDWKLTEDEFKAKQDKIRRGV